MGWRGDGLSQSKLQSDGKKQQEANSEIDLGSVQDEADLDPSLAESRRARLNPWGWAILIHSLLKRFSRKFYQTDRQIALLKNAIEADILFGGNGVSFITFWCYNWRIKEKGTKLHFKSPTAERRHISFVGVGGDRTHADPLRKSRVCPP
jgi:hypothetical protein